MCMYIYILILICVCEGCKHRSTLKGTPCKILNSSTRLSNFENKMVQIIQMMMRCMNLTAEILALCVLRTGYPTK